MRVLVVFAFLISQFVHGQIPASLVTERSVVIVDWPLQKSGEYQVRGDWDKIAEELQKNLSIMGIDAVAYLHIDDWSASASSQQTIREYFLSRLVKHLIVAKMNGGGIVTLTISDFSSSKDQWNTSGGSLSQALLRLGRAIKLNGTTVENFLSADSPEIVSDVPFSKWSATTNFPDQIKRLKIGVAKTEKESDRALMQEIIRKYPFEYEFIDYINDEDAFAQGYQIVLLSMNTSGESIKKLLNYKTGINETHYLSTVSTDSAKTKLKTIPVDALVTKFYFRQTINHEAYVGRDWDADTTWQQSLINFLTNLRIAFKVN